MGPKKTFNLQQMFYLPEDKYRVPDEKMEDNKETKVGTELAKARAEADRAAAKVAALEKKMKGKSSSSSSKAPVSSDSCELATSQDKEKKKKKKNEDVKGVTLASARLASSSVFR